MLTDIAVAIGFIIAVIVAAEFSCPPRMWKESHRRVKRKSVQDQEE